MQIGTRLLHTGHEIDKYTRASAIPIHQATVFSQPAVDQPGEYVYTRAQNPTREALENIIAELEGGVRGFAFASGMAAISTALMLLSPGDHLIVTDDCYGGTYQVLTRVLNRFQITFSFADTGDPAAVEAALRPETKALWIEPVSNPFLRRTDVAAMAAVAQRHGLLLMVDNTFLSPYLSQPLREGADVVVHSASKYLGGHSDVMAGTAAVRDKELGQRLALLQIGLGSILAPHDCFLVMRGIKTLQVRMDRQIATAAGLAEWLATRPEVTEVHYPGTGAMVTFRLARDEMGPPFVAALKLPLLGPSLGGVESLVSIPARFSHATMPADLRQQRGITDGLIRFSVGLEDEADLRADIAQALAAAAATG